MKTIKTILAVALATVALLSGCAKEKVNEQAATEPAVQAEGSRTIAVSFAPQTKTALGEDGLTPEFKAYEDTIKVAKKDGSASPEDCPVYIENEVAVIHTDLEGDLVAVYPSSAASIDGNVINGVRVPSKQTGKFADANICSATILAGSQSATFKNETAILKFYVDKSIGVTNITLSDKVNIADGSSSITVTADEETSILFDIVKGSSNERICYVAVKAGDCTALQFTSVTNTQENPVQKQLSPIILTAGTMYKVFIPYYIEVNVGTQDQPNYQKWGYCNIGAFLPEEPGYYFSWGNVDGHRLNGEDDSYLFNENNYKETDGAKVMENLTPGSDAARQLWGPSYHVPTIEDFTKTFSSSDFWVSHDFQRIIGGFLYETESSELFLPAAGYYDMKGTPSFLKYDNEGRYWTSLSSDSDNATIFCFGKSTLNEQIACRYEGHPIRPIYGDPVPDTPTDAIGEFTVGMDSEKPIKVRFSKGNLQATYDGKIYNWGFAEHQYDYIGEASGNVSIDNPQAGDVVDLFGWVGQSSSFTGAAGYGISNDENDSDYSNDVNDVLKSDWGNTIDDKGTWRTLSKSEWEYLLLTREMPNNGARFQDRTSGLTLRDEKGEDATGYGIVLFPDGYTNQETWTNTYKDWEEFASNGLVFLPTAGRRRGNGDVEYSGQNQHCYYWTSTHEPTMVSNAYYLWIYSSSTPFSDDFCCSTGNAVRLVTNSTTNN